MDLLLDAAASGINYVEREGISYSHPAKFILVGTMNPEEGELRPQLIDRFGLCVQVEGELDPDLRVEIIKRRGSFDQDPLLFLNMWAEKQENIRQKVIAARQLLPRVKMVRELEEMTTEICLRAMVQGHRADLVMVACARTLAALSGRGEVSEADVLEAAEYVLPHRLRESAQPKEPESPEPERGEESGSESRDEGQITQDDDEQQGQGQEQNQSRKQEQESNTREQEEEKYEQLQPTACLGMSDVVFRVGEPFPVRRISYKEKGILRRGSGRRSRGQVATKSGRYVRSSVRWERNDLAFDATLRAAAPHQKHRQSEDIAIVIRSDDLREKVREKKVGNLLIFVVDASGSMGAEERMVEAKGAILSLLLDAYQKRDQVGMVAFRGDRAEVILPPTNSVERAEKLLSNLPTGGRTPLSLGLLRAYEMAQRHLVKDPDTRPLLVIISDGKATVSLGEERPLTEAFQVAEMIKDDERIKSLVIDAEPAGFVSFELAKKLARAMDADYCELADLKADGLVGAVHSTLQGESQAWV